MPRNFAAQFPKGWTLVGNGVSYGIYHGKNDEGYGITESVGPEGRRALVYFQCYWDDRNDLIAGLLGTVEYIGGTIVRTPPATYPVADRDNTFEVAGKIFPARTFCTAIASVQGTKSWTDPDGSTVGLAGWPGYALAIIAAEFTTPPYLIQPLLGNFAPTDPSFNDLLFQNYVTSRVDIAGEVFSPPSGAFIWSAGGADAGKSILDVGAAQIRSRLELSATRMRMPIVPTATVAGLVGTVNAKPIPLANQLFPTGSALFMGMKPEARSDPYNGGIVWDVEYKWVINGPAAGQATPLDWNYFLDSTGAWARIETKVGGATPFAYQDHSPLFLDAIS